MRSEKVFVVARADFHSIIFIGRPFSGSDAPSGDGQLAQPVHAGIIRYSIQQVNALNLPKRAISALFNG
jgi:hypothetical protein